jgi:hypothetical protein
MPAIIIVAAMSVPAGPVMAANASGGWLSDTMIGRFLDPGQRNERDRQRILSVLAHQRAISIENGRVEIHDAGKLKDYYISFSSSGRIKSLPEFTGDDEGNNAGQFWQDFFQGKHHEPGEVPTVKDPFANPNMGLATAMHNQLQAAADLKSLGYADTAATLKPRGIDILHKDMKRGLAAGADAMIRSLDVITGGTSRQAVGWAEEMAEAVEAARKDPSGTALSHLKGRIDEQLKATFDDKLKAAMGEKIYDEMMEKYSKYGDRQQRFQAMMEDLEKVTGDRRFGQAAELAKLASTDAIAKALTEKAQVLLPSKKTDKKWEDGKDQKVDKIETVVKPGIELPPLSEDYGIDEDELTENEREALVMLDQVDRVSAAKFGADWQQTHPMSAAKLTRFANIVRDSLTKDGVLDPHDQTHIAALSRLLATAMVHGRESKEYQDELDAFVELRRRVLAGTTGEACEPGSETERVAAALRDRGYALRDTGKTDQATKFLQQSLELCENEDVAQALGALKRVDQVFEGPISLADRNKTGAMQTGTITGRIRLTISGNDVTGTMQSLHSNVERSGEIRGTIDARGNITASIEGGSVAKTSGDFAFLMKALLEYRFQGVIKGRIDGGSATGTLAAEGPSGTDTVTLTGKWRAQRQ